MNKITLASIVALVAFFLSVNTSHGAEVPQLINYQGKLTNGEGESVATGEYSLTFKLWDHATDTGEEHVLWTEVHESVPVIRGLFNVVLGGVTSGLADALSGADRFVSIAIGEGDDVSPRQQLLSAPYALRAKEAEGIIPGADNVASITVNTRDNWEFASPTGFQAVQDGADKRIEVTVTVSGDRPVLVSFSGKEWSQLGCCGAVINLFRVDSQGGEPTTILSTHMANKITTPISLTTIDFPPAGTYIYYAGVSTQSDSSFRIHSAVRLAAVELFH